MGKDVTVGDRIASEMFTHGLEGVYRYLEEYYKSIYAVTLPVSTSSQMTFKEAVAFIMNNLPPSCDSYECIRSYVDDETHKVTCIFQKTLRIEGMTKEKAEEEMMKDTFSYQLMHLADTGQKLKEEVLKEFGKLLISIWAFITRLKRT